VFFGLQGEEAQSTVWDIVSSGSKGEGGWVHAIFCNREEMQQGRIAESGPEGLY